MTVAQGGEADVPTAETARQENAIEQVWCAGVLTTKCEGKFWWAQEGQAVSDSSFASWGVEEVADWVQSVQGGRFAAYAEKFRTQQVDGKSMAALTQERLKAIGVQDPKTRGILLAAISTQASFATDAAVGLAVDPKAELDRRAVQKQREASPEQQEADPVDAAALVLRTILGANGTPEVFTTKINEWRAEHAGKVAEAPARVSNGILVAARVRPVLADSSDNAAIQLGDFEAITVPTEAGAGVVVHLCGMRIDGKTPKIEHKPFTVHTGLGPGCDERRVFELARPLVEGAVAFASRATVVCYGQTGSGKTHTLGHLAENVARHLFEELSAKYVALEAFELKGGAKGMLQLGAGHAFSLHEDSKPELALYEGPDGVINVGGSGGVVNESGSDLNVQCCTVASSATELVRFFREAERRRLSQDTHRNAASSRTHAFYRFHLAESRSDAESAIEGPLFGTGACIELVDLAGSESNKDSLYHDKVRVDEMAKINHSLSALNDCISKTVKGAAYVPFRADKLTQLLRPCFVGRPGAVEDVPSVLFMACLSPLASDSKPSTRTLTYTQQLTGLAVRRADQRPKAKPRADNPLFTFD